MPAGGVSSKNLLFGVDSLVQQKLVRLQSVVNLRGVRMLRGQSIVDLENGQSKFVGQRSNEVFGRVCLERSGPFRDQGTPDRPSGQNPQT